MKIEKSIYPYNPDAKTLPFFLSGIGGSEYQNSVQRPNGYMWDQILLCAGGNGTLEYEDTSVKIKNGDIVFLPKEQAHYYYPNGNYWNVLWAAFEGSDCESILKRFGMTSPMVISPKDDNSMETIFKKMISSQENDILYCDHTCSGLVYEYILEFHRLMDKNTDSKKSRQISMLLPVLRYMHDNFRNDISMSDLSDMLGITPQHFCRIFRNAMDMRPNEFLIKLRIDEAKRLICDGNISITEAAARSGFRDPSYFSTVFRKYVGISPNEFYKASLTDRSNKI